MMSRPPEQRHPAALKKHALRKKGREKGAALLAVLILVGVLGALAAGMFDRLRLAISTDSNALALARARMSAMAAEKLIMGRLDNFMMAHIGQDIIDEGAWLAKPIPVPLPVGKAEARLLDGGNCFNLNSLVTGDISSGTSIRPRGVAQFVKLATDLGLQKNQAKRIAISVADWIDSDKRPGPSGAEDTAYRRAGVHRDEPYLPGNVPLAEVSELRAVAHVTPAIYKSLRPWLCALPDLVLSPINVNSLSVDQAALLAMLDPRLTLGEAKQILLARPAKGWASLADFTRSASRVDPVAAQQIDQAGQAQTLTRYFRLDMRVYVGDATLHETALIDTSQNPSRLLRRRWTEDE